MEISQLQDYLEKLNNNVEQLNQQISQIDQQVEDLQGQKERLKTQVIFVRGRTSVIQELIQLSENEQDEPNGNSVDETTPEDTEIATEEHVEQ